LKREELPDLCALMLANNEIVMKEMHRREKERGSNLKARLKAKGPHGQTPGTQI